MFFIVLVTHVPNFGFGVHCIADGYLSILTQIKIVAAMVVNPVVNILVLILQLLVFRCSAKDSRLRTWLSVRTIAFVYCLSLSVQLICSEDGFPFLTILFGLPYYRLTDHAEAVFYLISVTAESFDVGIFFVPISLVLASTGMALQIVQFYQPPNFRADESISFTFFGQSVLLLITFGIALIVYLQMVLNSENVRQLTVDAAKVVAKLDFRGVILESTITESANPLLLSPLGVVARRLPSMSSRIETALQKTVHMMRSYKRWLPWSGAVPVSQNRNSLGQSGLETGIHVLMHCEAIFCRATDTITPITAFEISPDEFHHLISSYFAVVSAICDRSRGVIHGNSLDPAMILVSFDAFRRVVEPSARAAATAMKLKRAIQTVTSANHCVQIRIIIHKGKGTAGAVGISEKARVLEGSVVRDLTMIKRIVPSLMGTTANSCVIMSGEALKGHTIECEVLPLELLEGTETGRRIELFELMGYVSPEEGQEWMYHKHVRDETEQMEGVDWKTIWEKLKTGDDDLHSLKNEDLMMMPTHLVRKLTCESPVWTKVDGF